MKTPYLNKRIEELASLANELWCGRSGGLEKVEDELNEMKAVKQLTLYHINKLGEILKAYTDWLDNLSLDEIEMYKGRFIEEFLSL